MAPKTRRQPPPDSLPEVDEDNPSEGGINQHSVNGADLENGDLDEDEEAADLDGIEPVDAPLRRRS